jgi:hypothetical protein
MPKIRLTHSSLAIDKRGLHTKLIKRKLTSVPSLLYLEQTLRPAPQMAWPDHGKCTQRMFCTNHQLTSGEHAGALDPRPPKPGASRHW